jgi:hypothetical protein
MFTLQSNLIENAAKSGSAKELSQAIANCNQPLQHRGPMSNTHVPFGLTRGFPQPPGVNVGGSQFIDLKFVDVNIPPWVNVPFFPLPPIDMPGGFPFDFPPQFGGDTFNYFDNYESSFTVQNHTRLGDTFANNVTTTNISSETIVNEGDIINRQEFINEGDVIHQGDVTNQNTVINQGDTIHQGNTIHSGDVINQTTVQNYGPTITHGPVTNNTTTNHYGDTNHYNVTNHYAATNHYNETIHYGDTYHEGDTIHQGDTIHVGDTIHQGDTIHEGDTTHQGDTYHEGDTYLENTYVNVNKIYVSTGGDGAPYTELTLRQKTLVTDVVWEDDELRVTKKTIYVLATADDEPVTDVILSGTACET